MHAPYTLKVGTAATLVLVALAACGSPTGTDTPAAEPSNTATPVATPTSTPSAEPVADEAACKAEIVAQATGRKPQTTGKPAACAGISDARLTQLALEGASDTIAAVPTVAPARRVADAPKPQPAATVIVVKTVEPKPSPSPSVAPLTPRPKPADRQCTDGETRFVGRQDEQVCSNGQWVTAAPHRHCRFGGAGSTVEPDGWQGRGPGNLSDITYRCDDGQLTTVNNGPTPPASAQ